MRYAGFARLVLCGWVILIAFSTALSVLPSVPTTNGTGQVRGTVKDREGAVVPQAVVTVERYVGEYATDGTGKIVIKDGSKYRVKRKAVTDNEGGFAVRLRPGVYRVTAERDLRSATGGYHKYQGEPFLLTAGGTKTADITLRAWAADVVTIP